MKKTTLYLAGAALVILAFFLFKNFANTGSEADPNGKSATNETLDLQFNLNVK